MNEREELLEQIPLLAAGALDEAEAARARELLGRHEDCVAVAASYGELDALLRRTLARPVVASVKRHCPYCKDDLRSEPEVLCAKCLTPHHKSCFSENRGCSLLGCAGTKSVSAAEATLDVCPSCGEHTPTGAPFCAWCRTPLGGARLPRHVTRPAEPVQVQSRARFLATCAALLLMGLSTGWLFETRQNMMMDQLILTARQNQAARCEREAESALLMIREAQLLYRERTTEKSSGGNWVLRQGEFATTVEDLAPLTSAGRIAAPGYEIRIVRSRSAPGERFAAIAMPVNGDAFFASTVPPPSEREAVFLGPDGNITRIHPASEYHAWPNPSLPRPFYADTFSIDEDTCELVEGRR
jgi:hypothetical protein